MASSDFPNGIADVNEYLDTRHHVNTDVQGQVGDNAKVVIKSEYDFTLREIICNLLAGRGLKLPNIQVCLSVNLKAILGVDGIQQELYDALDELDSQFDQFMEHTEIEQVLGRINNALAEVTQISNMINFCAAPIAPVAIPNVLEQTMDSFLGAGKDLIDQIGNMVPDQVGGCLGFDGQEFNLNLFNGGILGDIASQWDAIKSGQLTQNQLNSLTASINKVKDDMRSLIERENNVAGTEELGGSQFTGDVDPNVNTEMGVLHNSESAGIQGNTRLASQLKAQYDRLAGYPVVDKNGKVYNNIFELFLEPGLIDLLNRLQDPSPEVGERQPVFNYCGEIVGYTAAISQTDPTSSNGVEPGPLTPDGLNVDITSLPGYQAGGLNTTNSGTTGGASGSSTTIINSTTVSGGVVKIVGSLSAQLSLLGSLNEGDIVVRSDENIAYAKNNNNSNTIADFTRMATPVGTYLQHLDGNGGVGIVVKDGLFSQTRQLKAANGQLEVVNSTGQAGDIEIKLAENPVIPGTAAIQIPAGTTAQRPNTTPGELRYNTTNQTYEGYFGGTTPGWRTFTTGGTSFVSNASNLGGGAGLFLQNNNGNLEFKSILQAGGITVTPGANTVTISDTITASNIGAGDGEVVKQRNGNDFELRTIQGENNIAVNTTGDTVVISGDPNKKYSDPVISSTAGQTEVLFNGSRITPDNNTSWFITVTAIGKVDGGSGSMAIKREAVVDNTSGSITLVSDDSTTTVYNNNVGGAWDLEFDTSNNDFRVYVVGENGVNIKWNVKVDVLPTA